MKEVECEKCDRRITASNSHDIIRQCRNHFLKTGGKAGGHRHFRNIRGMGRGVDAMRH